MAGCDPLLELLSVEFEVYGKVQGCYFPKFTRDLCTELGIVGWVKNSKSGTIMGKMQGPKPYVDQIPQITLEDARRRMMVNADHARSPLKDGDDDNDHNDDDDDDDGDDHAFVGVAF